jgi:hypothetical protein
MPRRSQDNDGRRTTQRTKRLAVAVLLVAAVLLIGRLLLTTPEERLASLDAARAVPEEDNAATIYAELLRGSATPPEDSNVVAFAKAYYETFADPVSAYEGRALHRELAELELPGELIDPNGEAHVPLGPWTSSEYPALARWLDTHRDRIGKLQEAARKPVCYFPACPRADRMNLFDVPLEAFKQHALLLHRAANNDFGEGRTDEALTKYCDLISMGRHMSSQPAQYHLLVGIVCEAIGLSPLTEFIVTGDATDRRLDMLAARCGDLENRSKSAQRDRARVRRTFAGLLKDERPLRFRMALWYAKLREGDEDAAEARSRELYLRVLCERRALRLLIELRRAKNRTGRWPSLLIHIAPAVPAVALIDPQNNGPFRYYRASEGFGLYSAGPNGRDEGGGRGYGRDDWPIWPIQEREVEKNHASSKSGQ